MVSFMQCESALSCDHCYCKIFSFCNVPSELKIIRKACYHFLYIRPWNTTKWPYYCTNLDVCVVKEPLKLHFLHFTPKPKRVIILHANVFLDSRAMWRLRWMKMQPSRDNWEGTTCVMGNVSSYDTHSLGSTSVSAAQKPQSLSAPNSGYVTGGGY